MLNAELCTQVSHLLERTGHPVPVCLCAACEAGRSQGRRPLPSTPLRAALWRAHRYCPPQEVPSSPRVFSSFHLSVPGRARTHTHTHSQAPSEVSNPTYQASSQKQWGTQPPWLSTSCSLGSAQGTPPVTYTSAVCAWSHICSHVCPCCHPGALRQGGFLTTRHRWEGEAEGLYDSHVHGTWHTQKGRTDAGRQGCVLIGRKAAEGPVRQSAGQ